MKARQLRRLLKSRPVLLVGGAHDALSAKLIEEAGYDAIWASSFGISAATKCMPDANVLTMTEALEAVKGMNQAVSIPVIADCDNGYGNVHNVIRMVREYESAGIAGISIEDNPFPKKCSLYPGERPELVDRDEMAGRISAAKATQRSKDFFVIARTEALIAGLGMEEALGRARAYEEAGADAILIHSRKPTPDEIREFAARWKSRTPLVVVPTKYPSVKLTQLRRMGIKVVIHANQALRASVTAMKDVLRDMRRTGSLASVEPRVTPLSEVFRLVGQPDLESNDEKFIQKYKQTPSAVITAAGFERSIWPLNSDQPKALLDVRGKSILEHQVDTLRRAGVQRIAVVAGYKSERISVPGILKYRNADYARTGMVHSLLTASQETQDRFLHLYGDVLVDEAVVHKLLRSKREITIVVHTVRRRGANNPKSQPDWVKTVGDEHGEWVARIGHHLRSGEYNGEYIGLSLFSKRGAELLRAAYRKALRRKKAAYHNASSLKDVQMTDVLQEIIDQGGRVHVIRIASGWFDIETFEDYRRAWRELSV